MLSFGTRYSRRARLAVLRERRTTSCVNTQGHRPRGGAASGLDQSTGSTTQPASTALFQQEVLTGDWYDGGRVRFFTAAWHRGEMPDAEAAPESLCGLLPSTRL